MDNFDYILNSLLPQPWLPHINRPLNIKISLNLAFNNCIVTLSQWALTESVWGSAYLLKDGSLVDLLSGDVTYLQDAQRERFEGWLLDQVRVMNIQAGEDGLRQGVTLQPCYLEKVIQKPHFQTNQWTNICNSTKTHHLNSIGHQRHC